jgi:hypothetical protein
MISAAGKLKMVSCAGFNLKEHALISGKNYFSRETVKNRTVIGRMDMFAVPISNN